MPTELEFQFVEPLREKHATIQQAFESFDRANPWVYARLVRMARELQARGVKRYGIKSLFEVLRWQFHQQTTGSKWKLNNNFTSRYARLIEAGEPELRGFFEMRTLKSL